jgi:alkylhydroperoxidase family enzyme
VDAIKQRRWRELTHLTPRQIALCTVAEKLTLSPTKMMNEDWQPLRDLGFDDQALLEVAYVISIFNFFPRMADGFGLVPDPMLLEAAASGVPLKRAE